VTTLSTVELRNHPDTCSLIPEYSLGSLPEQVQQLVDKFLGSEVYQQTLIALQEKIGAAVEEVQPFLGKLVQEAIRLTYQSAEAQSVPSTEDRTDVTSEVMSIADAIADLVTTDIPVEVAAVQTTEIAVPPAIAILPVKKAAEPKAEPVLTERDLILQELGQKIQQVRQAQGMSLSQLYSLTYVPMHHLKSLEEGRTQKLPEDVFLRGFIQRICDALALDGEAIVAQIPTTEDAKRVVPKWQKPAQTKGSLLSFNLVPSLAPAHLYVGYAVLMAGAVSGLAAITQPVKSNLTEYAEPVPEPNAQSTPVNTQSQSTQAKPVSAVSIAPPEMM
jgi:cytoskeleton protein RodZ